MQKNPKNSTTFTGYPCRV